MIGDARGAGSGRMNAVRLIQLRDARHALPAETARATTLFSLREILKDLTELRGVLFPVVRRRLHPDEQHRDAALPGAMDDALEVLLHLIGGQPA